MATNQEHEGLEWQRGVWNRIADIYQREIVWFDMIRGFLSIFGDGLKRHRVYISYLDTPAGYHKARSVPRLVARVATPPSRTSGPARVDGPRELAEDVGPGQSDGSGDRGARGQTSASSTF